MDFKLEDFSLICGNFNVFISYSLFSSFLPPPHLPFLLNSNPLATWWEELTHLKRPWCWERLKAGGEGDNREWDGWMASLTWWTWVWVNSGSWWWTGRPGMLQFMGSQGVGHDWVTELNWTDDKLWIDLWDHGRDTQHRFSGVSQVFSKWFLSWVTDCEQESLKKVRTGSGGQSKVF